MIWFGKSCVFPKKKSEEKCGDEKCLCGKGTKWKKATTGERGGGPAESHSSVQPACSSEEDRTSRSPGSGHLPQTVTSTSSREMALIGAYIHLNSSFMTKTQNQGLFSAALPAPTQRHSSAAPSPRHHKMAAPSACHRPGTRGGSGPAPQGRFPASRPPQHSSVSPAAGFTSGVPREGLPPSSSSSRLIYLPRRYPHR